MLFFIFGSIALGIAWVLVFWVASFAGYLVTCLCSLLGIYVDISGDKNVWFLFLVVLGISVWVFNIEGSNFGYAIVVFLTGSFMLFRSVDMWRIGIG